MQCILNLTIHRSGLLNGRMDNREKTRKVVRIYLTVLHFFRFCVRDRDRHLLLCAKRVYKLTWLARRLLSCLPSPVGVQNQYPVASSPSTVTVLTVNYRVTNGCKLRYCTTEKPLCRHGKFRNVDVERRK